MNALSKKTLTTAEELAQVLDRAAELLEALAEELAQDNQALTDGFDACIEAMDTIKNPGRFLTEPETKPLGTQIHGIRERIELARQQHAARASILTMLANHLERIERAAIRLEEGLAPTPRLGSGMERGN